MEPSPVLGECRKQYCIRSSYGGVSKITVGISSADQEVGLLAKVGTGTELEIGIRLRKNERKMPSRSFSLTIKTCLTRAMASESRLESRTTRTGNCALAPKCHTPR
jgi:hypothetical protein